MNKIFLVAAFIGLTMAVSLTHFTQNYESEMETAAISKTDADFSQKVTYVEDMDKKEVGTVKKETSFLEIKSRNPLPFNLANENTDCSHTKDGSRLSNTVGQSQQGTYTVADVGACQTACAGRSDCNAFSFYTGTSEHGKCVMCSYLPQDAKILEGTEQNSSVSYKAGCNCINRYPDVPCECQKPKIKIDFPDANAGMDSVFDPMNPGANNNAGALVQKKDAKVTK